MGKPVTKAPGAAAKRTGKGGAKKSAAKPKVKKRKRPYIPPQTQRERGRPVVYRADYHDELAYRLRLVSDSEEQIAEWLGLPHKTLIAWKARYDSFSKALERGGMPASAAVVESLHRRATGFTKVKTERVVDPNAPDKPALLKITEEFVPGDLGAIKLWNANTLKRKGLWSEDPDASTGAAIGAGFGSILASLDGATRGLATSAQAADSDGEDDED